MLKCVRVLRAIKPTKRKGGGGRREEEEEKEGGRRKEEGRGRKGRRKREEDEEGREQQVRLLETTQVSNKEASQKHTFSMMLSNAALKLSMLARRSAFIIQLLTPHKTLEVSMARNENERTKTKKGALTSDLVATIRKIHHIFHQNSTRPEYTFHFRKVEPAALQSNKRRRNKSKDKQTNKRASERARGQVWEH